MKEFKANELLAINNPSILFINDINKCKNIYRGLVKEWHPDVNKNPNAENVFKHITNLYNQAIEKIEKGIWITPNTIEIIDKTGAKYRIKYLKKYPFELGDMYISNTIIAYFVDGKYKDFYNNFLDIIKKLKYNDDKLKKQFEILLPKIKKSFETNDGKFVLILDKPKNIYPLRDVLDYFKGRLDPRHVAWIMSRLHALTCYLSIHGLTHNDISLDTCFIDPENHAIFLLGGWWYSKPIKTKLLGVTKRTLGIIPSKVLDKKISNPVVDLELIRLVGRELFSDPTGMNFYKDKTIPKPLVNWLRGCTSGKAIEDYEDWGNVLDKSFGERKFIKMEINL